MEWIMRSRRNTVLAAVGIIFIGIIIIGAIGAEPAERAPANAAQAPTPASAQSTPSTGGIGKAVDTLILNPIGDLLEWLGLKDAPLTAADRTPPRMLERAADCAHWYDGNHDQFEDQVRPRLDNPNSMKTIATNYQIVTIDGHNAVAISMRYSAENAYGDRVETAASGYLNLETCDVAVNKFGVGRVARPLTQRELAKKCIDDLWGDIDFERDLRSQWERARWAVGAEYSRPYIDTAIAKRIVGDVGVRMNYRSLLGGSGTAWGWINTYNCEFRIGGRDD